MTKIFRTIAFVLVFAGLLAWGVSTLAKGPSFSVSSNATQMHGRVIDNAVEAAPSQLVPYDR